MQTLGEVSDAPAQLTDSGHGTRPEKKRNALWTAL